MDYIEYLIVEYLKEGYTQPEIAQKLKELELKPNSLSSVEKKICKIRELHNARTLFHLAFILSQSERTQVFN